MLPWRRLLLSGPAWACGIAVIGSQWADATLMLGVTKYLKLVYGFSIENVLKDY
jgi:MFS transporter, ACS family, solute carrier family 17 (sodium-dependent inorganic phosphate cotransporter), other